jgi:hypothetical protein
MEIGDGIGTVGIGVGIEEMHEEFFTTKDKRIAIKMYYFLATLCKWITKHETSRNIEE